MDYEQGKKLIVDYLNKKKDQKTQFYFSDLAKVLGLKPREAKKIISEMVQEGILVYWTSGSTSMYKLAGVGNLK